MKGKKPNTVEVKEKYNKNEDLKRQNKNKVLQTSQIQDCKEFWAVDDGVLA